MIKTQKLCTAILAFCLVFSNRMSSLQQMIGENQIQSNNELEKMIMQQKFLNTMQSTSLSLLSSRTRKLREKFNMLLKETDKFDDMHVDIQNLTTRIDQCKDLESVMEKIINRIDNIEQTVENITKKKDCVKEEWVTYNGVKYFFSSDSVQWRQAKANCRKHGEEVYLASIPSFEVNAFLIQNGKNGFYWTGGNDINRERRWVWDYKNVSVTFTDWRSGEPNNSGDKGAEDCMVLITDSSNRKHWNDVSCYHIARYICQKIEN